VGWPWTRWNGPSEACRDRRSTRSGFSQRARRRPLRDRTVAQISFLTNLRQHLVQQHIALSKQFDSMRAQEAACQVQT